MSSDLIAVVSVIVVAALALMAARVFGRGSETVNWPLYARKPLSQPEQVLYFRLCEALPEYVVLAQVEITRVVGIKKGRFELPLRNRLRGMTLDFVVCLKDATVVAAIELDDKSHDGQRARERDAKKDKALAAAGIPLKRWRTRQLPSIQEVRDAFIT